MRSTGRMAWRHSPGYARSPSWSATVRGETQKQAPFAHVHRTAGVEQRAGLGGKFLGGRADFFPAIVDACQVALGCGNSGLVFRQRILVLFFGHLRFFLLFLLSLFFRGSLFKRVILVSRLSGMIFSTVTASSGLCAAWGSFLTACAGRAAGIFACFCGVA